MAVLSVNLNKIALIRNSREGHRPSVVEAAKVVIEAGCKGITVHPRPDQRHIRPGDVYDLAELLTHYNDVEFNIEGNPLAGPTAAGYPGFDHLIETVKPHQVTLVPDSDDQLTSDHGYDFSQFDQPLADRIARYQALGCRVSLFMDPDLQQISQAKAHGTDRIELYTGPFAELVWQHGTDHPDVAASFVSYENAAQHAAQLGMGVNAGHDLDLQNLPFFCRISEVNEVSIGHALISDALQYGLFETTRKYLHALTQGSDHSA